MKGVGVQWASYHNGGRTRTDCDAAGSDVTANVNANVLLPLVSQRPLCKKASVKRRQRKREEKKSQKKTKLKSFVD